ncbi:hypothetical protein [Yersinia hibernica]|uniref:hypothetical protein n=1 Tax=Yersinia hibernica TaxID=2339259 RepID=UPI0011AB2355|nr:hypothetical protein [Yersinia hibernica]
MSEATELKMSAEWTVDKGKNWSVTVKGWNNGSSNCWNVYLNISDSHQYFSKPEDFFHGLPFHGGATYDRIITTKWPDPIHDFQRDSVMRKIGSDYQHLYDSLEEESIKDGIPYRVLRDAEALSEHLKNIPTN